MNNTVFGNVVFNTGWKTNIDVTIFGQTHNIVVKAKAYTEKDTITRPQEASYKTFLDNKNQLQTKIESLLNDFSNGKAKIRFTPSMLEFNRDGAYALLLHDTQEPDNGIAVCLAPNVEVMTQDDYL